MRTTHLDSWDKKLREKYLFAAATSISLLVSFAFIYFINRARTPTTVAVQDTAPVSISSLSVGTVSIYVPKNKIPLGSLLSGQELQERAYPRNMLPKEAVLKIADLAGKYAAVDLLPDIPIVASAISADPSDGSIHVSPGMRAVTVEVSAAEGNVGLVNPGSKVDLILTLFEDKSSSMLMENIKVISRNGSSERENDPRQRQLNARLVYTIEVSPKQALEIQTARRMGELSFALRNSAEKDGTKPETVNPKDLTQGSKEPVKVTMRCGRATLGGKNYIVECQTGKFIPEEQVP